jgi:predicted LPLAT superfamily acyltransferase
MSAMNESVEEAQWDATSRGGLWGHWLYLQIIRFLGPRVAALLLYPVVTFYFFWAGEARRASMQYLERVLGPAGRVTRWLRTWRHLHAFGTAYLDGVMLGALGREIFEVEDVGLDNLLGVARGGKGSVMLTAHLGTWELPTGMLKDKEGISRVAVVMFKSDAAQLQGFIERMHGKRPRVIAVGDGELSSLEILRAARNGEMVAMQGDRTVDKNDLTLPFFGRDARWPIGPWVIAALSGVPLLWSFALRVGPRKYLFVTDPPRTFRFERGRTREEQLAEWMGGYVKRLEEVLREHPYQWFNFFDFWAEAPKLPKG